MSRRLFRDNIEGMAGYVPGYQPRGVGVVKLNTNENPYGPSPSVVEAIKAVADDAVRLRRYPPVFWDEFRTVAAQVHGVKAEQIVCGNGGDELLTMLVRCCCDKGRGLAYPVPTYSLYAVLAQIQDCPVIEVPFEVGCRLPVGLKDSGAALTIVCNPNAPTGAFVGVDEIAELAGQVAGVLLVDEAYVDFAEDNCLRLLGEFDNVAILRSLSKGYSLAGLRFGYVMASEGIVEAMIKVKDSYNVNVVTQAAAVAAVGDQEYFRGNVAKIVAERERLTGELRGLGFEMGASQTNFLLARIGEPSAEAVHKKLAEKQVFVRYFQEEGLADKLRITVGTAAENDALLVALREIVI